MYLFVVSVLITISTLTAKTIAQSRKLALYLDASCNSPSTALPTVQVPLSTCLVPVGVYGVAIESYPSCSNGNTARMVLYKDSVCGQTTNGFLDGSCYWYFVSFTIPGLMFTCDDASTIPQATSTLSVTATPIPGAATQAAASSTLQTQTKTASATSSTTATVGNGTSSSSTTVSGSTSASASSTSSPSSGLSMSDKIGIGVGLGTGIPSVIIALAAWCWPRHR